MKISAISSVRNFAFRGNQTSSVKHLINEDRMLDHFVKLAKVDTGCDRTLAGVKSPTTSGQLELANILVEDLKKIGLEEVTVDEFGIVTATLPANSENLPTIGFIAHMDTSPDAPNSGVVPVIRDYEGGEIALKNNQIIAEEELKDYKGHKIITSDGATLLGADDKAGISEIIEALKVFVENPQLKRPTIKVAFTPDEEGADGIENLDIKKFNADVAYTVDGTRPECFDTETFNAFNPLIKIKGVSVHPGFGYQKMINPIDIANEFINMLPADETPSTTKDKQGYYLVDRIDGNMAEVNLVMAVRDFDYEKAEERVEFLHSNLEKLKEKYPQIEYSFEPNERYQNMKNVLAQKPEIILNTVRGIERTGLDPKETSVRGGTDGSHLTLSGLPCPNIGAGGENFHSCREFISLESMKKCCENIINIAQVWAGK